MTLQTSAACGRWSRCAPLCRGQRHRWTLPAPGAKQIYALVRRTAGSGWTIPYRLGKPDKGLVRRYLAKVTGLSRAQLTRLIGRHRRTGRIEDRRGGPPAKPLLSPLHAPGHPPLLARLDAELGQMSGPANARGAAPSMGGVRRLPGSSAWRGCPTGICTTCASPGPTATCAGSWTARGPRRWASGCAGDPLTKKCVSAGAPSDLDTVHHLAILDGVKGVYHINAVDEVTQWQQIGTVRGRVSEAFLIFAYFRRKMLGSFPLRYQRFPCRQRLRFYINQVGSRRC